MLWSWQILVLDYESICTSYFKCSSCFIYACSFSILKCFFHSSHSNMWMGFKTHFLSDICALIFNRNHSVCFISFTNGLLQDEYIRPTNVSQHKNRLNIVYSFPSEHTFRNVINHTLKQLLKINKQEEVSVFLMIFMSVFKTFFIDDRS